ncbi:MAG TPA: hypothetical protein VLF87_00335, partial [Patescibacteria group bacterium]|nr:hypothetical protein [Patescibacteria group bacterium]
RVTEKHGDAARELRLGSLLFVQSEGARKELSTNGMVSMINALAHWRHEPFTAKNSRRLGFLPDASPAVRTRVFLESWKGLTPFHDCIDVVPAQDTQALALQLAPDIIVSYDSIRNIHFRAGQEPSAEQ